MSAYAFKALILSITLSRTLFHARFIKYPQHLQMDEWTYPTVVNQFLMPPVRRLDGVTYWVIEDPEGIYDFINKEIRKEWEADARSEGREPKQDQWLITLSKRRWRLEIVRIDRINLNPNIMNYVDDKRGYRFSDELARRSNELRKSIEEYCAVIWPLIVGSENFVLVDGYCRYTALRMMNVQRIYTYVETL